MADANGESESAEKN